jgi:hypothetical protein
MKSNLGLALAIVAYVVMQQDKRERGPRKR